MVRTLVQQECPSMTGGAPIVASGTTDAEGVVTLNAISGPAFNVWTARVPGDKHLWYLSRSFASRPGHWVCPVDERHCSVFAWPALALDVVVPEKFVGVIRLNRVPMPEGEAESWMPLSVSDRIAVVSLGSSGSIDYPEAIRGRPGFSVESVSIIRGEERLWQVWATERIPVKSKSRVQKALRPEVVAAWRIEIEGATPDERTMWFVGTFDDLRHWHQQVWPGRRKLQTDQPREFPPPKVDIFAGLPIVSEPHWGSDRIDRKPAVSPFGPPLEPTLKPGT